MNLSEFVNMLTLLEAEGHGNKTVYYRHGASSDCGLLSSAHITSSVDDCGPFDLKPGEEYVSIYAGN